ncbi:Signal recognition particle protein [bacterium HR17]|uniref:Signal recognition particle protein n=1 Tax=Candidatus Fervidibacter japonicus TaxID=2035412 RepID=A0A2H5X8Y8_9BACT|nr:Signal recognition particle protein [bacterium HR17]
MWRGLTERLQSLLARWRGRGRITEEEIDQWLRELRISLLEADVNLRVARQFVGQIRDRLVTPEVMEHPNPSRRMTQIVFEELTKLLGEKPEPLRFSSPVSVFLLLGLQGAGKTTTCGKLAAQLKKQGRRPLLVAADLKRPAAIDQLQQIAERVQVPVFAMRTGTPEMLANAALQHARANAYDVVLVDSAGRLHTDEELVDELRRLKSALQPHEALLVLDAATGQDAVRVAETFDAEVGITGVILTKLDSDARGGAVLSVRAVTGKPIKLVGTGEHLGDLDVFYPDRMAARILGLGDVSSLMERVEEVMDEATAKRMEERIAKGTFGLDDLLLQLRQMKQAGPLEQLLSFLPGLGGLGGPRLQIDERKFKRMEAIILSMTPEERRNPDIIDGSRKRRIAKGSGTTVQDVNQLLRQFKTMRDTMKRLAKAKISDKDLMRLFSGL